MQYDGHGSEMDRGYEAMNKLRNFEELVNGAYGNKVKTKTYGFFNYKYVKPQYHIEQFHSDEKHTNRHSSDSHNSGTQQSFNGGYHNRGHEHYGKSRASLLEPRHDKFPLTCNLLVQTP
ncbi:unnamed protein product [Heligmosomoides polygyrus]|uniref:ZNF765 n=1 Tax=Heligmosomoides polygyrus TaxID=6339 RepID=A0A3P7YM62_HELPZ|nr:unnamed protein product [Heligmosomoides polygyrus]